MATRLQLYLLPSFLAHSFTVHYSPGGTLGWPLLGSVSLGRRLYRSRKRIRVTPQTPPQPRYIHPDPGWCPNEVPVHTHGWIWGTYVSYGPTNSVGRSVCTSNSTACKEVLHTLRAVSAKQPGVCNL